MKDDAFCALLVRGSIEKKNCCETLYVKDATDMLRKQVEFCGKDGNTFLPGHENALPTATYPIKITDFI